jgi:hypothetical protein
MIKTSERRNMVMNNEMREDGRFAIETFSKLEQIDDYKFEIIDFYVVYADNCEISNCIWMIPQ